MTKQAVLYLIILLAGLAGGTGLGYLMTQSKLDETQAAVDKLNVQIEELTAQSETDLKTANARVSRLEADLSKARNEAMRKNTEMLRSQTDLAKMKALLEQTLQGKQPGGTAGAAATPSAATPREPVGTTTTTTRTPAAQPTTAGGSREYTIKDGDSLWKIAAAELGNGTRFKDIIAVNPGMTENTTLAVGTKIKLPAR